MTNRDDDPAYKYLPKPKSGDPAKDRIAEEDRIREARAATGRWMGMLPSMVLFFILFPPIGLVMMVIDCNPRRLEATDYLLALIVPLYGHVMFWTCS